MNFSGAGLQALVRQALVKRAAQALAFALLLVNTPASAKDYRLDFVVKTPTGSDAGSVVCPYGRCVVKVEQLRLTIAVYLWREHADQALISIEGEAGCCFFAGGARTQGIVPLNPPPRLPFFVGQPGRGLLYVQNEPAGDLYLRLHFD